MRREIDLRDAINAISDVIQNRPKPLREFDQIYMKAGDMVLQSEYVASWAKDRRLAFIGDGDAISVCVAYLQKRGIIDYGPSKITVFDFDERIVMAIKRFADRERLDHLDAKLYNVLDAFPDLGKFDCFYTNPPWGASNNGESVKVFSQRGIEAVGHNGQGLIVIADDEEIEWPRQVLGAVQSFAFGRGFYVNKMDPRLHLYHLDDAPDLLSCNLHVAALPDRALASVSEPITDQERLENFYGRGKVLRVRYIREKKRLDYGKAHEDEYDFELVGGQDD